jgi:hypothetical protein
MAEALAAQGQADGPDSFCRAGELERHAQQLGRRGNAQLVRGALLLRVITNDRFR